MTQSPIHLPLQPDQTRAAWYRLSRTIALAAAVFSLIVAAALVVDFLRDRAQSPLVAADLPHDPKTQIKPGHTPKLIGELQQLQIALAATPENEDLKPRIRQLDLILRQQHFVRRARIATGAWLLLGGLVVLVAALKASTQLGATLPGAMTAFPPVTDPWQRAALARRAIGVISGLLIATLTFFAFGHPASLLDLPLPRSGGIPGPTAATKPSAPLPTNEQLMANWPCFRGFQGAGIVNQTPAPPTLWDGAAGKNILWKVPVPLPGYNSPIVWDDRIFLSGATPAGQSVFCFQANTGALLWQQTVSGPVSGTAITLNEETGYAPNTMATDGARVFAIFPTGDVAAFDFAGTPLWTQNLGKPVNVYGHAASLATYRDRLIVQFDQGDDPADKLAAVLALDAATGKTLWKTKRAVINSWSSPIVIYPPAGPQIITAARPLVAAYNPDDGKEIWSANLLDGDVAPSPTFAGGLAFVVSDQAAMDALRIDGHGDVTKSHLVWKAEEGLPDIVSPLASTEFVLLVHSGGVVTSYNAHNGKQLWQHDFELKFHASPALVGNTIYLTDRNGLTHFLDAGATYKELGTAPLGEAVSASPAFAHGRIYFRGKLNLYCIGAK